MYIVTGGGSGIGKALAMALAKRGKQVLIIGRREHLLEETASLSPSIHYFCADVSTVNGRESIRDHISNHVHIEALVNNAGTLDPIVPIRGITPEAWHHSFQTNVDAALFLPQLLSDKLSNGRVLNIGSGAAYFAIKGWTAYCVSKAALSMLTRCWQLESETIAFTSVMPGIIDTEMQAIARSADHMDADQVNFYKRLKEDNRLIAPEAVAEFLSWLLLDVNKEAYASREWDIYETSHHDEWLRPPYQILHWDY